MARPVRSICLKLEPSCSSSNEVIDALAALLEILVRADARRANAQAVDIHVHNSMAREEDAEHEK
jgi:hypothetical protein